MRTLKYIKWLKITLISLLVVALGVGGVVAYNFYDIWKNPTRAFGNGNSGFEVVDADGNKHAYNEGVITFMVFGVDSDEGREQASMGYRTDVMMACVVDTNKNTASLVSLPRDTRAKVRKLDSEGNVTGSITTRLNGASAYGHGPEKYGYENALDAINNLLTVGNVKIEPIEKYVGFDMDGFIAISNLLGGVELTLEDTIPGIGKEGETVTLKGAQAKEFVTIREAPGYLDGSDLSRTGRQRQFVKACAKKLKASNPITTIPKLYNECVQNGYIKTNLNLDQIAALATVLSKVDIDAIQFEMLPGIAKYVGGTSYYLMDEAKTADLLLKMFYNATGETGQVTTTTEKKSIAKPKTSTTKKTTGTSRTKAKTTAGKTTARPTTTTTTQQKTTTTTKATTTAATAAPGGNE